MTESLPTNRSAAVPLAGHPGWAMQIHKGAVFKGGQSYSAEVLLNGLFLCRIVMVGADMERAVTEAAITARVNHWIADYCSRAKTHCPQAAAATHLPSVASACSLRASHACP
jgi:hypothetical protein